jgi:hypothetical protein
MLSSTRQDGFLKSLALPILVVLLLVLLWPAFRLPGQQEDEGVALVYPEMFLKGHLPYRDFESVYGPDNLLILSGVYSLFGANIFVERVVGLIYRLLVLLAIFGIARRWGTGIGAVCGLIAVLLLSGTEIWANTWFAGMAFALCALWTMADQDSRTRCFGGGFLTGIALLCRCDFAIAMTAALLPLFVAMRSTNKNWFFAGAATGLLPLLYFAVVVGPMQLAESLFLLPVIRIGPRGHLPISTAPLETILVFCFYLVATATNLAVALLEFRGRNPERGRLFLGTALLGLALIHYPLSRFDSGHVPNAAVVSFIFLPLSLWVLASTVAERLPRWPKVFAMSVVVLIAIPLLKLRPREEGVFIEQNGRSFPIAKNQLPQAANQIVSELQRVSMAGQFLLIGPADLRRTRYCDTWIYHLFPQLRPASYFLQMDAGAANAPGSRLASDVARADWLILNRAWDILYEPNRSAEFGPDEPNQVVRSEFDLWKESGPYLLLRNKRLRNLVEPQSPEE